MAKPPLRMLVCDLRSKTQLMHGALRMHMENPNANSASLSTCLCNELLSTFACAAAWMRPCMSSVSTNSLNLDQTEAASAFENSGAAGPDMPSALTALAAPPSG